MYRIPLACVAFLIATGCSKSTTSDLMDTKSGSDPIAKTTQCTVPNADGQRCDVKTCKADQASDCAIFQDRCTQSGHSYSGDKNQGTCTRGATTGLRPRDPDDRTLVI